MADKEHLAVLNQGADAWNAWRREHPDIIPNLRRADLGGPDIGGEFLDFLGVDIQHLPSWLDLRGADLRNADLIRANLRGVDICTADLSGASLAGANLRTAGLTSAILAGTDLRTADLSYANLSGANLSGAILSETVFVDIDLSATKGLDDCTHLGPSVLDHRTLQRSGRLPLGFLKGCGVSDWQIEAAKLHQPDLTSREINDILDRIRDLRSRPVQIHNLFISYSHLDKVFVEHMEKHLDERGILFWRDIHDAPAGRLDKIVPRAIRQNPTMLLVLSEHSARSDWVEFEAQTARDLEKELRRDILCPVALDKSWETCNWSAPLRNHIKKYNVLDFSNWQNATVFEGKFRLLLSGIVVYYGDEGQHESQQTAE